MTTAQAELDRAAELREQGRYTESAALLTPLISRVDRECGARSAAAARVRNAYGLLLKATGRYAEAKSSYLEALDILSSCGSSPAVVVDRAAVHHNLAGIGFVLGEIEEAIGWGSRGLELRRTVAGPDDFDLLCDEGNLAPILIAAGELDRAERMLAHVHDQFVARLGADDYEVAVVLTNLGVLAARRGDRAAALARLGEAIRIKTDRLGPEHPELIRTLINIAVVAEDAGEAERAGEAVARARGIAERALPEDHELRQTLRDW
ncbi:tetratricopeptide repeat protein [Actinoplanes missouriensis]|uniref:tetratricopeptide repeat protein n=1 Tax=Actinoplanes missouriensis TaxID=1866 RepID=UPI0034049BDA